MDPLLPPGILATPHVVAAALQSESGPVLRRLLDEEYAESVVRAVANRASTVAEHTALLGGLDVMARVLINQFADWVDYCQYLADSLHRARRERVHTALTDLARDPNKVAARAFVEDVVRPLLCRTWLPQLIYGSPRPIDPDSMVFDNTMPLEVTEMAGLLAAPGGSLAELLGYMAKEANSAGAYAPRWSAARRYLLAADQTQRYFPRRKLPPTVPVLTAFNLAIAKDQYSPYGAGRITEALVVPRAAFGDAADDDQEMQVMQDIQGRTQYLCEQSLHPAWRAAEKHLGLDDGALMVENLSRDDAWLVLGDYPGGSEPAPSVEGISAGMALAMALVGRRVALQLDPYCLVSAGVRPDDGAALCVGELEAKGKAVAGRAKRLHRSFMVLVAAESGQAEEFTKGVGDELVTPVAVGGLRQAVNLMLRPGEMYEDLLARQVKEGEEAWSCITGQ